jgi:hypothetical protein
MADEVYEGAIGIDLGMFPLSLPLARRVHWRSAVASIINNFLRPRLTFPMIGTTYSCGMFERSMPAAQCIDSSADSY